MAAHVRVGDVGTVITVAVQDEDEEVLDISDATALTLYLRKPNRTYLTKTPTLYTDGTDGMVTYTSISGDWSVSGTWGVEVKVTFGTTVYNSSIGTFAVKETVVSGGS